MAQQSFAAISLLRHTRRGTHQTCKGQLGPWASSAKHPQGWSHGNVVTDSSGNAPSSSLPSYTSTPQCWAAAPSVGALLVRGSGPCSPGAATGHHWRRGALPHHCGRLQCPWNLPCLQASWPAQEQGSTQPGSIQRGVPTVGWPGGVAAPWAARSAALGGSWPHCP